MIYDCAAVVGNNAGKMSRTERIRGVRKRRRGPRGSCLPMAAW